jgi:hypothetical protein
MPFDHKPGPRLGLARAHERHTVNNGHAVSAIAGETQRATMLRVLARPHNRHCDRVILLVRNRRAVNDHRVPSRRF